MGTSLSVGGDGAATAVSLPLSVLSVTTLTLCLPDTPFVNMPADIDRSGTPSSTDASKSYFGQLERLVANAIECSSCDSWVAFLRALGSSKRILHDLTTSLSQRARPSARKRPAYRIASGEDERFVRGAVNGAYSTSGGDRVWCAQVSGQVARMVQRKGARSRSLGRRWVMGGEVVED